MANITLLGASYTDVPAIDLPKTGGGTVRFFENGGTPSQTQHTILFEFTDETSTSITAYWDGSFISDAIRETVPTTYNDKTVQEASLDGTAWYTKLSYTWETLWNGLISFYPDDPGNYPYCWVGDLGDVEIPVGSIWRVTFDGVESVITVTYGDAANSGVLGNPKYGINGADDGSGLTYGFYQTPWGAWSGGADVQENSSHNVKIERAVTT